MREVVLCAPGQIIDRTKLPFDAWGCALAGCGFWCVLEESTAKHRTLDGHVVERVRLVAPPGADVQVQLRVSVGRRGWLPRGMPTEALLAHLQTTIMTQLDLAGIGGDWDAKVNLLRRRE